MPDSVPGDGPPLDADPSDDEDFPAPDDLPEGDPSKPGETPDLEPFDPDDLESMVGRADFAIWFEPGPIPEMLESDYESGPFRKCVVCEETLRDERLYQIQKTYRGSEVVFEMAVCERCGRSTCEEFSKESMEVMQSFVGSLVDAVLEREDGCGACGIARANLQSYSIVGLCRGDHILLPAIIVCAECEEGVQNRLSKTTRERQGDFIRDNFPGVPADLDLAPLKF